ncbi:unnamed protein product [Symbiodinium natans]|uniref:Uncharacterized protein n=1 Tax=Symbiodinium natans TaxID=878477 RepID=A0A812H0T1_9DINO|nr:unnamed protein product [Symbiodinium natans]
MASILKSEAAFRAKAEECGLSQEVIAEFFAAGIKTISLMGFAVTAPGTQPSEDELRKLVDRSDPGAVPVGALSAVRRLMFECQTLCIAHVKASVDGDERKCELVPAERTARIAAQKNRLQGLSLTGPLECSFASYGYVASMVEQDTPLYLEPHRFDTRAAEVSREKPGKEIVLDANKIAVRDQSQKHKCAIQDPLSLSQALQRRSLACDLMSVCTYSKMQSWHGFLIERMQQPAPPGFRRPGIEQVLRADRAAWIRMAESVHSLKRDASGELPLDKALDGLVSDPIVLFNLLPLPCEPAPKADEKRADERPDKGTGRGRGGKGEKGGRGEKRKLDSDKNARPDGALPRELQGITGLNMTTEAGLQGVTVNGEGPGPVELLPCVGREQAAPDAPTLDNARPVEIMDSVLPFDVEPSTFSDAWPMAETLASNILASRDVPTRDDIASLFDLLPHKAPPRGMPEKGAAFTCGAFAQGPLFGLHVGSRKYPKVCRLLASFVRSLEPGFIFTTISLFLNVRTHVHVDSRNDHRPNLVAGISDFTGGEIVVESPGGAASFSGGDSVGGARKLPVSGTHVTFEAYKLKHETAPWVGNRLVLVAFSVPGVTRLCKGDVAVLEDQGFQLPEHDETSTNRPPTLLEPKSDLSKTTSKLQGCTLRDIKFVELFCGTGGVVAWCHEQGMLVSVENAASSPVWSGPVLKACQSLGFHKTTLHQCMFGSSHRKHSVLYHNFPQVRRLCLLCDDQHSHAPWDHCPDGPVSAYPSGLCKGLALSFADCFTALGCVQHVVRLSARSAELDDITLSRAAQVASGKQPKGKRIPPLVPSRRGVVTLRGPGVSMPPTGVLDSYFTLPADLQSNPAMPGLPAGSKCLRSVLLGGGSELVREMVFSVPKTPEEFVLQACQARHPRHMLSGIPPELHSTVQTCASQSYASVARRRTEVLRKWTLRAQELQGSPDPDPPVGHCAQGAAGGVGGTA